MNIILIGETCIDATIFGSCGRICAEGPVPVFNPTTKSQAGGMAANVLNNLKNLRPGFDIRLMTSQEMPIKTRFVDEASGQLVLRVDENDEINPLEFNDELQAYIEHADAVIVSDYDKGYLTYDLLRKISTVAKRRNIPTFMDTKKDGGIWAENFTFVKINKKEFLENNWRHFQGSNPDKLIVTLGGDGCDFQGEIFAVPEKVPVRDVTGAGDTFLAAFAIQYLESREIKSALNFAQRCCEKVIQKQGVAVPYE